MCYNLAYVFTFDHTWSSTSVENNFLTIQVHQNVDSIKRDTFLLNKHRGIVHSMLGVCLENTDANS